MSVLLPCFVTLLLITIYVASVQGHNSSKAAVTEISTCCPLDQRLSENGKDCVNTNLTLDFQLWGKDPPPATVGLVIGLECKNGRYRLEPYEDSNDEFKLIVNGSLYVPYHPKKMLSTSEYCLDLVETPSNETLTVPFICFNPVTAEFSWKEMAMKLYSGGCILSIVFLLMTLLVYTCTPNIRNVLKGKVLICHVACLTVAYFTLSLVLLFGSELPSTVCVLVAFCIQFSFLASFFWLNVLCLIMWKRLRSEYDPEIIRTNTLITSRSRSKMFLYYSLYAWGVPTIFVMITLGMDNPAVPSAYLKPNFGLETCWFSEDKTALSYFYAPIAIILLLNLILFVLSATSVNRNKATKSARMRHIKQVVIVKINQRRKEVFVECLILFLVMGFNWAFEVISWAVGGPPQLWFITDLYNTLQGIIVFYVFVYREHEAWQALVAFFHCKAPPDLSSQSVPSSNPLLSKGYALAPTHRK